MAAVMISSAAIRLFSLALWGYCSTSKLVFMVSMFVSLIVYLFVVCGTNILLKAADKGSVTAFE